MAGRRRVPLIAPELDPHHCTPQVRVTALSRVPFLAELDHDQLTAIDRQSRIQDFAADTAIYRVGQDAERLLVVVAGFAKRTTTSTDGVDRILQVAGPGDVLGALPVVGRQRQADSAWAITSTCVLTLPATAFDAVLRRHPSVALRALKDVSMHLADTQASVHQDPAAPLGQRLAAALSTLQAKASMPWNRAHLIQIPLSREDLAALVGARTESVSRQLSAWQRTGLVETGRRWIAVRDVAALAELARSG